MLSILLIKSLQAQTVQPEKPVLNAVKIDKPIELTGKLDNPVWNLAEPVELNYEVSPGDNAPASQKTLVKAVYNENTIYFGFQCFDTNPEKIRANVTDRDNMFQDDCVFVIFDTFGDHQRAYELAVNPFSIKGDLMRTGDNEDASFDMIWETAAAKNENGWTAEMAIPFSSLSFPDKEEQNWVICFVRIIPRESRTQISWTKIERNNPSLLAQGGFLKGITKIKSGGRLELLPYVMGQESGYLNNSGNPNSGIKYDPVIGRFGGGIKYSPNASVTIDAVVNPDFSQIESDADQISVNTTFALEYDEKRPFFLNGKELIPSSVYYSRSINNPLYAARIIGKTNSLTYLFMGAYDRNTVIVVPGEEESSTVASSVKSVAGVGRLRYDFGNETYIGTSLFSRNMEEGHNYVLGVDWGYRFWGNWNFKGEAYLSQTKELNDTLLCNNRREFGATGYNAAFDGENYSGTGYALNITHSGRSYAFGLEYSDLTPTFQTYNGLVTSAGYRNIEMDHEVIFYPEKSFLTRAEISLSSSLKFNMEGQKKEQTLIPGVYLSMKGQTSLGLSYLLVNDENFYGTDLKNVNRVRFNISTRPLKEIYLYFNCSAGNFIYRTSDPVVGKGHSMYASLEFKPTSKLDISVSYNRAQLNNKDTDSLFYNGNIYRGVAIYQFSPEFFIRTIFQYNTFSQSFQIYPLFSYKLNAFTTFFAGATSNYYNYEGEFGYRNTEQQYFVKLQYLIGI